MRSPWKANLAFAVAVLLLSSVAFADEALQFNSGQDLAPELPTVPGPITGRITFTGSVTLDTTSVNTASMVMAWSGRSTTPTAGLPMVQSRDGDFATFVSVGDGTVFQPNWSFNTSSTITNFWSVDGFQFDLSASHIVSQANGFLFVTGTGTASGNGFLATPGTFSFTTQDPSASGQFSFSAASAVPESSTVSFFGLGVFGLIWAGLFRRKSVDN